MSGKGWGTRWETPGEILERERQRAQAIEIPTATCSACGEIRACLGGTWAYERRSNGTIQKRKFICRSCRSKP